MILKLQRSIATMEDEERGLIYNQDRSIQFEGPLSEDIRKIMGERYKMFVEANVTPSDSDELVLVIEIMSEAPWQEW